MSLNGTIHLAAQTKTPEVILNFSFPAPSSLPYCPLIPPENTSPVHLLVSICIAPIPPPSPHRHRPSLYYCRSPLTGLRVPLSPPADFSFSTQLPKQSLKTVNHSISLLRLKTSNGPALHLELNPTPHPAL